MSIRAFHLRGLALRRVGDEALLEYARQGQEVAFAELYRRFHGLVYGYCLARLMDPAAAEDVTQETFMRINRSRSSESINSARAWIFTVARSAVIDHVRRSKRLPDSLSTDDAFELVAANSDAADGAMRREDAKLVFLALARLRPRYRSALLLREMHGLTSVEMGEALTLKPGAVDTLVCRARDAFGREYAELGDLQSDCRRAVEYIYRDRGTGIEEAESAWLSMHVASCPRCARERSMAGDPKRLAILLPLAGIRPEGFGVLQRALEAFGAAPASFEGMSFMAAKVTAVAIVATMVITPGATRLGPNRPERARRAESTACATVRTVASHEESSTGVTAEETTQAPTSAAASTDVSPPADFPSASVVVVEGAEDPAEEALGDSGGSLEPTAPPVSAAGTGSVAPPPSETDTEPVEPPDALVPAEGSVVATDSGEAIPESPDNANR